MPVYREDEWGRYLQLKERPTPPVQRYGEKVDLTKYWQRYAKWDAARPRGGSLVLIAKAAITHSKLAGHGPNCTDNNCRERQVRTALDALSVDELEWLAHAVDRAARFARDREISRAVKQSVVLSEDRHRHGEHNGLCRPEDDPIERLECPLCNSEGWRRYVYG